jgi:group I intron endonuclease
MGKTDRDCGVYGIICSDKKMYIGQSKNIKERWDEHLKSLKNNHHFNSYLQNAFNKYGEQAFTFEVLKYCKSKPEELNKWETYYIYYYQTFNPACGYNQTPGGNGIIMTDEIKKKISKGNKGRKISEEWRRKISEANKGKKRTPESIEKTRQAHLGKNLSESHKNKIGMANKGKVISERTKELLRQKHSGKKISEEQKEKLRQINLGKKHSIETKLKMRANNIGKKLSEEHKNKIGLSNCKYLHLVEEWKNLRSLGFSYMDISKKYNIRWETIREYVIR